MNIGSKVSDITLTLKNRKKIYLSVKFGNTLALFNVGVKKEIFPEDKMKKRELNDFGREYLDMFDIDHEDYLTIFEKYDKANTLAVINNHKRSVRVDPRKHGKMVRLIMNYIMEAESDTDIG